MSDYTPRQTICDAKLDLVGESVVKNAKMGSIQNTSSPPGIGTFDWELGNVRSCQSRSGADILYYNPHPPELEIFTKDLETSGLAVKT